MVWRPLLLVTRIAGFPPLAGHSLAVEHGHATYIELCRLWAESFKSHVQLSSSPSPGSVHPEPHADIGGVMRRKPLRDLEGSYPGSPLDPSEAAGVTTAPPSLS